MTYISFTQHCAVIYIYIYIYVLDDVGTERCGRPDALRSVFLYAICSAGVAVMLVECIRCDPTVAQSLLMMSGNVKANNNIVRFGAFKPDTR